MWEEFIKTTNNFQRLDYVWRYSTIPITVPENVATHSYYVSTFSAMIHQNIDPDDTETLMICSLWGLMHDTPELESGDFVRTFKYRTEKLKDSIDEAESHIINEFGLSHKKLYDITQHLIEKSQKARYIRAVVKAADFMSLHNFMIREFNRGNREILPFFDRMVEDLKMMAVSNAVFLLGPNKDKVFEPAVFYKALVENAISVRGKI